MLESKIAAILLHYNLFYIAYTHFHLYHVKKPANFSSTDLEFFPIYHSNTFLHLWKEQKIDVKNGHLGPYFLLDFAQNHYILWFEPLFFFKTQFCIIITVSTCGGTDILYYMAKIFSLPSGRVTFFVKFPLLPLLKENHPFINKFTPHQNHTFCK